MENFKQVIMMTCYSSTKKRVNGVRDTTVRHKYTMNNQETFKVDCT